jgi:hypothetical protein
MAVTPERAAAIAKDVRRDPIEPGQELALDDDDLGPPPEVPPGSTRHLRVPI